MLHACACMCNRNSDMCTGGNQMKEELVGTGTGNEQILFLQDSKKLGGGLYGTLRTL